MKLFLTGAVGCGKSTVIDRALSLVAVRLGGFRTGFGPGRASPERSLYLWPGWERPCYDEEHVVARFTAGEPRPLPERFNALGVACLTRIADLYVMDECGRLEWAAVDFQAAVKARLDGTAPVLGVLREGFPGWTATIAARTDVKVITVTAANRDGLAEELVRRLGIF